MIFFFDSLLLTALNNLNFELGSITTVDDE